MAKQLITNLTFDASEKKVTFSDFTTIELDRIFLVINKLDTTIMYNLGVPGLSGTVATNVLTLEFDSTSMEDGDSIIAFYSDPTGLEGRDVVTYTEYVSDGASTGIDMVGAVAAGVRKAIVSLEVTLAGDSAADVAFRIGFSTSTTMPTEPSDEGNVDAMIMAHDGLSAGSGMMKLFPQYAIGADNAEIRMTNTTPTTGKLKVIIGHLDLVT